MKLVSSDRRGPRAGTVIGDLILDIGAALRILGVVTIEIERIGRIENRVRVPAEEAP